MIISRAKYDELVQQAWKNANDAARLGGKLDAALDFISQLRDQLRQAHERERALIDQLLELKREGFNPTPKQEPIPAGPALASEITEAMLSRAKPGSDLWRQMATEIEPLVGVLEPAQIKQRILNGAGDPDAFLE